MAELTDGVVLLRPPRASDAQAHCEAVRESIEELVAWMPWARPGHSLADSEAWVETCVRWWETDPTRRQFFIVDGPGRFLGNCDLTWTDEPQTAAIGYWVRSSATRAGIASRAVSLLSRWATEDLGMRRLRIMAEAANLASRRVAEKAGFRQLPGERAHVHDDGSVHRLVAFELDA